MKIKNFLFIISVKSYSFGGKVSVIFKSRHRSISFKCPTSGIFATSGPIRSRGFVRALKTIFK